MKNNSKSHLGLIFILVGVVFLLMELNIFNFSFSLTNIFFAIVNLWPITLIVIGLSILFNRNTIIKIILWVGFLVVIILYSSYGVKISPLNLYMENGRFSFKWDEGTVSRNYTIENIELAEKGNIVVDLAGCSFNLEEFSKETALIETNINEITYENDYEEYSKTANIKIWEEKMKSIPHKSRYADILLMDKMIWDMNINLSAVNADLDLSEIMLNSLKLNVKAGNTELFLGEQEGRKDISIEGTAVNIKVYVPENSGIQVISKGSLMNINDEIGLEEKEGKLVSKNYENAETIYDVQLDLNAGNITLIYLD